MSMRDSISGQDSPGYLSKKVVVNGQTVTLYSSNGQTWLSSPEEIPEVMARLENTRILLNDPKAEAPQAAQKPVQSPAVKPAAAKYRMRGPKQRPILQQNGAPVRGTPIEPISSSSVEVRIGGDAGSQPSGSPKGMQLAKQASPDRQKLVAPVSSGPNPRKAQALKEARDISPTKVIEKSIAKAVVKRDQASGALTEKVSGVAKKDKGAKSAAATKLPPKKDQSKKSATSAEVKRKLVVKKPKAVPGKKARKAK